jgi:hypothetical protein
MNCSQCTNPIPDEEKLSETDKCLRCIIKNIEKVLDRLDRYDKDEDNL